MLFILFFLCTFSRISELVERETEEYHKADPDPFDDRHPGIALLLLVFKFFFLIIFHNTLHDFECCVN